MSALVSLVVALTIAGEAAAAAPDALPDTLESPEEAGGGFTPHLDLFGFASVGAYQPLVAHDNKWLQYFPSESSFIVGNLNLYLAAAITPRVRSMLETRFLVVPEGTDHIDIGTGRVLYTSTEVQDPAEFGRTIDWAGILVERAWIEFEVHSALVLRAGRLLTPYGVWNVDHGAPVIVGIRRPWTIRSQLFPERQTGLELYGVRVVGATTWGYHLTVSNGRGPGEAMIDLDSNKAIGGRLHFEWRGAGRLNLGASFYRGRYTDPSNRWIPSGALHMRVLEQSVAVRYDEQSFAADARYAHRGLLLQSELVVNDRRYTDPGRPVAIETLHELTPDFRRWGVYGLAGWRLPWANLMPYLNVESFHYGAGAVATTSGKIDQSLGWFLGVNYRPAPALVLKLEWFYTMYPNAPSDSWGTDHYSGVEVEAAWAF